MREKVKNLIYLDAERYIDIDSVKVLPWATIILPFSVIIGSSALQWTGMIVAACICFFSSLILIRLLKSNRIKKTFRLRFLVNGIVSLYIFVEISLFMLMISMALKTTIMFWVLSAVIAFIVLYICIIVCMVHNDGFKSIQKVKTNRKFQKVSMIAGVFLPASGLIGYFLSKSMNRIDTITSTIKIDVVCILTSFVLVAISLGFINFVQYFYCVKYGINCDERGQNHSPCLEYTPKRKKQLKENKKLPLLATILIGILCVLVSFFIIHFIIGFIKAIIK